MATKKRIFCDTNILIDLFDSERTTHIDAVALLWYALENASSVDLIASVTSFKDAYYILSRLYHDKVLARQNIADTMGVLVDPVDMRGSYGAEALASEEPDFEDALIALCAEHERASVLLTNDSKAFTHCSIPSMSAAAFLAQEGFDYSLIEF